MRKMNRLDLVNGDRVLLYFTFPISFTLILLLLRSSFLTVSSQQAKCFPRSDPLENAGFLLFRRPLNLFLNPLLDSANISSSATMSF